MRESGGVDGRPQDVGGALALSLLVCISRGVT